MTSSYRQALDPPSGELSPIETAGIETAIAYSRSSPRGRVIAPFHKHAGDTLHRMLNAVQPHSYIRPHRHLDPPKAEAWVVLRGALAFFTFEDEGSIRDCMRVSHDGPVIGIDLAPGVYHSFVALEPDTVIFEVKPGPYAAQTDKAFAPFSPEEGSAEAEAYRQALLAEYERRS